MRKCFSFVAIALVMVLGSYSMAKDAAAKPLHGKVTAVTKDAAGTKIVSLTISSHGKKGDPAIETVVTVDESTKVAKADGSEATLADLPVGTPVNVTCDDAKKASAIAIRAPHKKPADSTK